MSGDSDSSDAASSKYSTTNVMLGYASKEPTDDAFSQLGGFPVCTKTLVQGESLLRSDQRSRHGQKLHPHRRRAWLNAKRAIS